jgi:hypothetical protein
MMSNFYIQEVLVTGEFDTETKIYDENGCEIGNSNFTQKSHTINNENSNTNNESTNTNFFSANEYLIVDFGELQ